MPRLTPIYTKSGDSARTHLSNGLRYLNRLSDALFMRARLVNQTHHQPETLWDPAQH